MSLTRVAPSKLVPGANGVFLTRAVKKLTPIEVAPLPNAIAPPYLVNLIHTPSHTISLRRFLALRHQFSTGLYFNIATSRGWYLLVPSHHAPLADTAGLAAWRDRHHHKYLAGKRERNKNKNTMMMQQQQQQQQSSSTAVATSGNETGKLNFSKTQEEDGDNNNEGEDDEDEDEDDDCFSNEMEEIGKNSSGSLSRMTTSHQTSQTPKLLVSPLTIAEDHLFEINDGILWEMPPRDDLANCEYWKLHRERMQLYEDTNSGKSEEELLAMSQSMEDGDGKKGVNNEVIKKEQYIHMQQILQALTRKANVRLEVDDQTHLLTLVPIVNLKEGEELFLHYGREWWSQRLLSSVFMSVSDAEMRNVRWIESLFMKSTDVSKPFPLLCSALAKRKRHNKNARDKTAKDHVDEITSSHNTLNVASEGKPVLYNVATQRKATDMESLVFALRRTCVNHNFFTQLVGANGTGVFDVSRCDEEVPLRQLRRVLLASLREEEQRQLSQSTLEPNTGETTTIRIRRRTIGGEGGEKGIRGALKEDEEDDGSLVL